nr:hypothetical protein [Tanacetum cinerariifolium]
LVPVKSNSYYQAFNVKSLYGEIDCPKKSQYKLKGQIKVNGCWDLVVEVVGCSRDGERGGKTREKGLQGKAGNTV